MCPTIDIVVGLAVTCGTYAPKIALPSYPILKQLESSNLVRYNWAVGEVGLYFFDWQISG